MHFLESSENIFFKKNIHLQLIRQSSLGLRPTGQLGREPSSAGKLIHRREEVGVKRVQVTTGDEVTSSKEHEHSASVWSQKHLHVNDGRTCHRGRTVAERPKRTP